MSNTEGIQVTQCECVQNHPESHEDSDECMVEGPEAYQCTRPEGHDGAHIACTVSDHPVAVWTEEIEA